MKSVIFALLGIAMLCCCSLGRCARTSDSSGANRCFSNSPSPLWETQLTGSTVALTSDYQKRLYIKTNDRLVALSLADGAILWQQTIDFRNASNAGANMAVTPDYVAVDTATQVLVFESQSGNQVWQYTPSATEFFSNVMGPQSLIIGSEILYVGFAFDLVIAFDLADGTILWKSTQPQGGSPYLALADYHLIGVKPFIVYSLDARNGELEWENTFEDMLYRPTILNDEQVLVNGRNAVYVLNLSDGQMAWQSEQQITPGMHGNVSAVVANDTVIWTNATGQLMAAHSGTGEIVWQIPPVADVIFPPLVIDSETLWVRTSFPARLQRYALETGEQLESIALGKSGQQMFTPGVGPVIVANRVFLTDAARVFACTIP